MLNPGLKSQETNIQRGEGKHEENQAILGQKKIH